MKINLISGRFNPFTIGHKKLLSNNNNLNCLFVIDGEKTGLDKNKNPLTVTERIDYINSLKIDNLKVYYASNIIEVIDICEILNFTIENVICGEDRTQTYSKIFTHSNILTYDRNDGISATKIRRFVVEDNFEEFDKLMPGNNLKIFDLLKSKLE